MRYRSGLFVCLGIFFWAFFSCETGTVSSFEHELYVDTFSDNSNGWTESAGGEQTSLIADGLLTLTTSTTTTPCTVRVMKNGTTHTVTGKYRLGVDLSFPSQPDSTYAKAFIQFNYYTTTSGAVFDYISITSSGYYLVGHYPSEEGDYYYYTNGYVASRTISREGLNQISITQYGGGFSLSLNGVSLGFYTNEFYSDIPYQCWLGLEKGSNNNAAGTVRVAYDKLVIYQ